MTWHYHCPSCGQDLAVDWAWHKDEVTCPSCKDAHYPPTPYEDRYAWFAGDAWPQEMTDAVTRLRGMTCGVPGCFQAFSVIVHRKPPGKGGKTSADNLAPLCAEHARAKADQDYDEWLAKLKAAAPQKPAMEITITAKTPPPQSEPTMRPLSFSQSFGGKAGPLKLPERLRPLVSIPFLPGPINRLVFSYDWRLESEGSARVVLMAWPHDLPPRCSGPDAAPDCPQAANVHTGKAGETGSSRLELLVAEPLEKRWIAAVVTESSGARISLAEYLLAGTD